MSEGKGMEVSVVLVSSGGREATDAVRCREVDSKANAQRNDRASLSARRLQQGVSTLRGASRVPGKMQSVAWAASLQRMLYSSSSRRNPHGRRGPASQG